MSQESFLRSPKTFHHTLQWFLKEEDLRLQLLLLFEFQNLHILYAESSYRLR
jgi:hypothetical protein